MARFEVRVSDGWLERVDAARGFESRGSFVRRLVDEALGGDGKAPVVREAVIPLAPPAVKSSKAIAPVDPILKDSPSLPPGVAKGTAGVKPPFKCGVHGCKVRTTSPNATCRYHGGKVIPNV